MTEQEWTSILQNEQELRDAQESCQIGFCGTKTEIMNTDSCQASNDTVNHPSHYQSQSGIECIEVIKASMSRGAYLGFLHGNALKYLYRLYRKSNPLEDARKAQWYVNRFITEWEKSLEN